MDRCAFCSEPLTLNNGVCMFTRRHVNNDDDTISLVYPQLTSLPKKTPILATINSVVRNFPLAGNA